MSKCIEITVNTPQLWAEHISYLLMEKIGCSGTVMEENAVKGYITYREDLDLSILDQWQVSTKEIKDEEWSENWKKYWHPQKISEKVVIRPSWEEYEPKNDEIIIELDPGSAFGTGTHQTTRLCVQALEKVIPEFNAPVSMADVGTGSGILSIAGIKLGVKDAVGVDNDASVISIAAENAEKNGIADKCEFYAGSAIDIKGKYEIVVANILAEVIIEIIDDLINLLKPGGKMILSGIIDRKCEDVKAVLVQKGLQAQEVMTEGPWVTIIASY